MTTSTNRPSHGADPWWGGAEAGPDDAVAGFDAPVVAASPRVRQPARRRVRQRAPWWVRLLRLPFVLFGRAVRRSPRLRTALVRLAVLAVVSAAVLGSVGVILLNNIVIHRTAELGKLDQERRELRRDNAVLDAQGATKSAQTQIVSRAGRLGMKRTSVAPTYTYLNPQSSDRLARMRAANAAKAVRAARAVAAANSPTPGAAR